LHSIGELLAVRDTGQDPVSPHFPELRDREEIGPLFRRFPVCALKIMP